MARPKAKKTKKKATRKTTTKTTTKRKVATRKATTKKTATKKATVKGKATKTVKKPVKRASPKTALKSAPNKSEIMSTLAENTELSKKEIVAVFEELSALMHRCLRKGGAGEFTIPGLMKCVVKNKPATKARKGINPFTGEETTFKAKPASNVIKVRPLKKLKEMAAK